jgi:hypothetical protein
MHHQSTPAGRPTTFVLAFTAGDEAHLAAADLEQAGFRSVVSWLDDGGWQLETGALTRADTEAGALDQVRRVADRYRGRVDHAHGGWAPASLELVQPVVDLAPGERGDVIGLWTRLVEAVENHDPSPFTTLAGEWAAELERRFDVEWPVDDGWITPEPGAESQHV